MQGVRQVGPSDVRASAPGGSDSIVSETLGPLVRPLGRKSQIGVQELQPAASKRLATAQTRTKGVMFTLRPRAPAAGPYGEGQPLATGNAADGRRAELEQSVLRHCMFKAYRPCESRPNACRTRAPGRRF